MLHQLTTATKSILKDSIEIYWTLLKVMVPVMIAVRIAEELGAVEIIAEWFAPLMAFVGLPGEMGIVWVTALLINIYSSAIALVGLLAGTEMTVAQATVLTTMILIAHALPVENRLAQLAGPTFWATSVLRVLCALILGWILNEVYLAFDYLQEPVEITWLPTTDADAGWIAWTLDSVQSLVTIFFILIALMSLLKVLDVTGITAFLIKLLTPFLRVIGISDKAAPMTMSGLLLGLSYGGALMLREVRKGNISRKDVFLSVSFLCLSHAIIEDTLLAMAMGGDITGVLIARVLFSILVTAALAVLIAKTPEHVFERWLCRAAKT